MPDAAGLDDVVEGIRCQSCGSAGMSVFYEQRNVPVHSVLLMPDRETALGYPRGNIVLGFCSACGFVGNLAFDPGLLEYSGRYEETQGFSDTFGSFQLELAERLIARHDLRGKHLVEIGCGKGDFLNLLCELGPNTGIGYDPAWVEGRADPVPGVEFVKDFYSEEHAARDADFYCCKMTLEHIRDPSTFVELVRSNVGGRGDAVVFFQVPNLRYILRKRAFWDIYYEHCSYFSPGALTRLFREAGFQIVDVWTGYEDQYVMIEASADAGGQRGKAPQIDTPAELAREVAGFREGAERRIEAWRHILGEMQEAGQRAVIWGAGSKGVAFLTRVGLGTSVGYCVDINPYKQGTYMPGTGHEIVGPERLPEYRPDVVIVMNPVYRTEIGLDLERRGLAPRILTVEEVG